MCRKARKPCNPNFTKTLRERRVLGMCTIVVAFVLHFGDFLAQSLKQTLISDLCVFWQTSESFVKSVKTSVSEALQINFFLITFEWSGGEGGWSCKIQNMFFGFFAKGYHPMRTKSNCAGSFFAPVASPICIPGECDGNNDVYW